MTPETYLELLRADTTRIIELTRQHPDVAVPACPGWNMGDLAAHLGVVQRWAADIVGNRRTEPVRDRQTPAGDPADWLEASLATVTTALEGVEPDEHVWGWAGDGRADFWIRRQAQEAFVHRLDAEAAAGAPTDVDPELAADGIDELLAVLCQAPWVSDRLTGSGETVHLHRTDGDGEWLVRLGDDGLGVAREHAKGDVAVRATALELLLSLWGRQDPEDLETYGDVSVLTGLVERIPF